jgi:hypothetical protein
MQIKLKPNLNGPESVPLREYFKDFPLTVTIFDAKDNVIRKETINYGDAQHRKWLGRVTWWACNNGYIVETCKAEE